MTESHDSLITRVRRGEAHFLREYPPDALRVGNSSVTLDAVAGALLDGQTSEEVVHAYGTLAVEDVGAVAELLRRCPAEVDEHLARRQRKAEGWQAEPATLRAVRQSRREVSAALVEYGAGRISRPDVLSALLRAITPGTVDEVMVAVPRNLAAELERLASEPHGEGGVVGAHLSAEDEPEAAEVFRAACRAIRGHVRKGGDA